MRGKDCVKREQKRLLNRGNVDDEEEERSFKLRE